jgi:endonuclease/exonuclease/phosphatase family metal-dependent hydrolase
MLVRAWNLHLGKTAPDGKGGHVREMVERIATDKTAIICLQEVPVWAFGSLAGWSGMQAVSVRTRRPKLGPLGIPGGVGKMVGSPGKGNAILVPGDVTIRQEKQITLNTNPFCDEQAGKLGLDLKRARWWERERRVCQVVHIERPDRHRLLIANVHATSLTSDRRLAEAELSRALKFVDRQAETEETVIVAGDFNLELVVSPTMQDITTRLDDRYSPAGPGVNHIFVRGRLVRRTLPSVLRTWSDEERMLDGKLLSDNAPVELVVPDPPPPVPPAPPVEEQPRLPTLEEAQRAAPLTPPPAPVEPAPAPPAPGSPAEPQPAPVAPQPPTDPQPTPVEPQAPTEPEPKPVEPAP